MTRSGFLALLLWWLAIAGAATGESAIFAASSCCGAEMGAERAFDGDGRTRWASETGGGEQWLQVDLGKPIAVTRLSITWEAAYAIDYEIQLSEDGAAWRSVSHQTGGTGGQAELTGLEGTGRFLRILCHQPTQYQLYSIFEVSSADAETAAALADARGRLAALRLEATRAARERLRAELMETGAREVVFASRPMYPDGHWYANFSYYASDASLKTYAKGGGLYVVSLETGAARGLLEDPEGTVRDPAVHYDGRTIVFSWRKGGTESFHLFTIQSDGTGLRQLTDGAYDDIEPAWLPDGGIVFASSRCRRWVNCWLTQVAVLHRCDGDGSHVVPLSANLEQDNTPWPMADGRILYTRWEYIDRSQVDYHHLWTMNPDGTAQTVFFGNMHPGGVFIDAKAVPGSDAVVFINSPGHGQREHAGRVALLHVKTGPDTLGSIRDISGDGYRDPYPVGGDIFLAAHEKRLVVLNGDGTEETLYALPGDSALQLHEPRPLVARGMERLIPRRVDYARETGHVILGDVYTGRNMKGVARGEIKRLLVLEALPKPINYTGGMDPLTYGGSFTLERILGTVPVEADGSASMELPANRALFFVAQDADGNSVKRMQSFLSVMPGETVGCVGCHENRTTAASLTQARLEALKRPPSVIEPVADVPDVFDFPRDIQPILDRHCVPCHDYVSHGEGTAGPRAGGVILSGDHGPMFSHSYVTLTVRGQFVDGRDQPKSNLPPRAIGSGASPLMHKIRDGHHGVRLTANEADRIRYWIDTGAAYPGTYAALGCGTIGGYYSNTPTEVDAEWPASQAATAVIERRCMSCHVEGRTLPRNLSDENNLSFWRPEWKDARLHYSRHLVFNLTRPEKSLIVLAPLAREAGGLGICPDVFKDTGDADYEALVQMCAAGKERLGIIKRFDMPGFCPPLPYWREMKRYGVLAADIGADAGYDFYQTDRAYWDSFRQSVALEHRAYRR